MTSLKMNMWYERYSAKLIMEMLFNIVTFIFAVLAVL